METKQLFDVLQDVDISHTSRYDPISQLYAASKTQAPTLFSVSWPNGVPCSLIEMYLAHRFLDNVTVREDGGTLRADVAKLSHLIRFCWDAKRDFWSLSNTDIDAFIKQLGNEVKPNDISEPLRNNNTIRAIVSTVIDFLRWLQDKFFTNKRIVGTDPSYQILLKQKTILLPDGRKIIREVYCRLPPAVTKEPKSPISTHVRDALWRCVGEMSISKIKFSDWVKTEDVKQKIVEFLKARRELVLELLEGTGARPGEIARLSVSHNENCDVDDKIVLVTLKRRRKIFRKVPVHPRIAIKLKVFINKQRSQILKLLESAGMHPNAAGHVFIGINGNPLNERTLTTEFSRITKSASLTEKQCCMSMFRHRFITKQVALHLQAFMLEHNKTRELMTPSDYRAVLKKVAAITGHGSELSLLRYIDLAWEELGIDDRAKVAISMDQTIERSLTQFISTIGDIKLKKNMTKHEVINLAIETMKKTQSDLREDLLRYRRTFQIQ